MYFYLFVLQSTPFLNMPFNQKECLQLVKCVMTILPSTWKMPDSVEVPQADYKNITALGRSVLRKKGLIYVVSGLGSESS